MGLSVVCSCCRRGKRAGPFDDLLSEAVNDQGLEEFYALLSQDILEEPEAESAQESAGPRLWTDAGWFNCIVYSAIILNAVAMGVQLDYPSKKYPDYELLYYVLENVFTVTFTVEMVCKWSTERRDYFRSGWNCIDCCLVCMAIFDLWLFTLIFGSGAGLQKLSVLRLLRILRVARMVRLLKVCKDLWLIIKGMMDSVQVINWVGLLLIICLYVCAIFVTSSIGHMDRDVYPGRVEDPAEFEEVRTFNNYQYFGSIGRSMYTLFNLAILVGDWDIVSRATIEVQPLFYLFLLIFITFTTFGLMNVIIGVIVDNTMEAAKSVKHEGSMQEKKQKLHALARLRSAVVALDADGDGEITEAEIGEGLKNAELYEEMDSLAQDLPHCWDANDLFYLLNVRGFNHISSEDFLKYAFRLLDLGDNKSLYAVLIGVHEALQLSRKVGSKVEGASSHLRNLSGHIEGGSSVPPPVVSSFSVASERPPVQQPLHVSQTTPALKCGHGAGPTNSQFAQRLARLERSLEETVSTNKAAWHEVRVFLSSLSLELALPPTSASSTVAGTSSAAVS